MENVWYTHNVLSFPEGKGRYRKLLELYGQLESRDLSHREDLYGVSTASSNVIQPVSADSKRFTSGEVRFVHKELEYQPAWFAKIIIESSVVKALCLGVRVTHVTNLAFCELSVFLAGMM